MKKHLYFINGSNGIGKSTTGLKLKLELPNCVFLDGDWCLNTNPKIQSSAALTLKYQGCCLLLNNFIHSSLIENIVFCSGISMQSIIDQVVSQLDLTNVDLFNITLIANEKTYRKRLQRAIRRGEKPKYWVGMKDGKQVCEKYLTRQMARMHKFEQLDGIKIDNSHLTVEQVVAKIKQIAL